MATLRVVRYNPRTARSSFRLHWLKKYKYPPEDMEDVIATIIGQCEMWTGN
jgi:type I restriction enzyme R subunit